MKARLVNENSNKLSNANINKKIVNMRPKNNIPSVDEFLKNYDWKTASFDKTLMKEDIIEFTRLHTKAMLRAILKNIQLIENARTGGEIMDDPFDSERDFYISKESILLAYPLENIK